MNQANKYNIAIIGLGYVGLPLAIEFGKNFNTIGFDIKEKRINDLNRQFDSNLEVSKKDIKSAKHLLFSCNKSDIVNSNIYIISVSTPIYENNTPNLEYISSASKLVASMLKKDDLVIYESTVYPGCTEDYCVPILEKESKLKYNKDFFCGYSPERINPGDSDKPITSIIKITSGSNIEIAQKVDKLYKKIIIAGTHLASSIKIAEAAKVIENTQRSVNIALMNELAVILNSKGIDTQEVLDAAGTKWNFLKFKPGLVGGHCIGVDPHYLIWAAIKNGISPNLILSAMKANDLMSKHIVDRIFTFLNNQKIKKEKSKILILGATYKENCSDTRNSKVFQIIDILNSNNCKVNVFDPNINLDEIKKKYKQHFLNSLNKKNPIIYDIILIAVSHKEFVALDLANFSNKNSMIFDIKGIVKEKYNNLKKL